MIGMTRPYVPEPGERVRITDIDPTDPFPARRIGERITVARAHVRASRLWLYVRGDGDCAGTYCRVSPVGT